MQIPAGRLVLASVEVFIEIIFNFFFSPTRAYVLLWQLVLDGSAGKFIFIYTFDHVFLKSIYVSRSQMAEGWLRWVKLFLKYHGHLNDYTVYVYVLLL